MIPGTSRSKATILGGMLSGRLTTSRERIHALSGLPSLPSMLGAIVYDVTWHYHLLTMDDLGVIAAGFVAAFIAVQFVVNAMIRFVAQHSLRAMASYALVTT